MRWNQLFNRAYGLALQRQCYSVMCDLSTMTEGELVGAVIFLEHMKRQ